jgi:acetyl-CoA C-acetyltransferase
MASQRRDAAIVGIHEYPLRVAPGRSAMMIKSESIKAALDDAGLKWSDIDAIYDTNDGEGGGGLGMASYLGLSPTVIDTTQVGGSSYEFQAAHAPASRPARRTCYPVHGPTAASGRRAIIWRRHQPGLLNWWQHGDPTA